MEMLGDLWSWVQGLAGGFVAAIVARLGYHTVERAMKKKASTGEESGSTAPPVPSASPLPVITSHPPEYTEDDIAFETARWTWVPDGQRGWRPEQIQFFCRDCGTEFVVTSELTGPDGAPKVITKFTCPNHLCQHETFQLPPPAEMLNRTRLEIERRAREKGLIR